MPIILENLDVKQIIIGKQYDTSENYKEIINLARNKKVKIITLQKGQRINIEKDLYIDVLWPSKNSIPENVLNNNSLVFKLIYNDFSCIFTGDIESMAEKKILEEIDNKKLKADILKVAHHGSKTSSIQEFIEKVKPKIALIGVGKNNTFGHPNIDVIERLTNLRCLYLQNR